jgi:serine/threonine-protein kinase HipA
LYERRKGWRLSPAYDINPTPIEIKPRMLSTAIDFSNNQASLDVALSVISEFRISKDNAVSIVKEVAAAVSKWDSIAKSFGLSAAEIERMASAFEHDDIKKANG